MRNLVIGMGEIGKAVSQVLRDSGHKVEMYDSKMGIFKEYVNNPDILHICFPYSDRFVDQVLSYKERINPRYICIWSTVAIGTTKQIPSAVHSPVEGRHPNLVDSIKSAIRWCGCNDTEVALFFAMFFTSLNLKVRNVENSGWTEALKLLSTTEYGINIVFADYKKAVSDDIDMPFDLTKQWNHDYNDLYAGDDRFQKFVLDYPDGRIGGHCVRENATILAEHGYRDEFTDLILEMEKPGDD